MLPCVLRKLGALELSARLAAHVDGGDVLPAGDDEIELRACAVAACERILAESNCKLTALDLDHYLWTLGKEPDFRAVERHYTRDTIFY